MTGMTADQFLQLFSQILYVTIFLIVAVEAARRPLRARIDIALLFAISSLDVVIGWVEEIFGIASSPVLSAISDALIMALPYAFLRLVDDFAGVPPIITRSAEVGLVLAVVSLFVVPHPLPPTIVVLSVLCVLLAEVYGAAVVVRTASRSSGVTRRRMQAIALGSFLLGFDILVAGLQVVFPSLHPIWNGLSDILGLGSGVAYFVGFTPPVWLRRIWQQPEVREFLARAADLTRLPDTEAVITELERGAIRALGATDAAIGIWNPDNQSLRFRLDKKPVEVPVGETLSGRAFLRQRALFFADVQGENPSWAETHRSVRSEALLVAPITRSERRMGVLAANASRAPVFADSDLELVRLLADQIAVILENRALIEEMARARLRAESLAAAEAERQRLYELLMQLPSMICRVSGSAHVVSFANQSFQRAVGESNVSGKPLGEVFQELDQRFFDTLDQVYASGEQFSAHEVGLTIGQPDGKPDKEIFLNLVLLATHDVGGAVDGVLVHAADVTDEVVARHEVELKTAEIRRLNADLENRVIARTTELQTALKELEAFSYSVSHDLRAPLRTIDGFAQALIEDYASGLGAEGSDYLRRIRAASQRMGMLIDGLLRLSRVARAELRFETVDLSALARSIAADFVGLEPGRPVEFVIQDGLFVTGDDQLLRALMENLLGNAWKFSAKRERARIVFGTDDDHDETVFYVQDNGVGFDMAHADKLFGAFQRLHGMSDFEGSGIGLATVQRIVQRHGGRIWAEGAVDRGATFHFTLGPGPIAIRQEEVREKHGYEAGKEINSVGRG